MGTSVRTAVVSTPKPLKCKSSPSVPRRFSSEAATWYLAGAYTRPLLSSTCVVFLSLNLTQSTESIPPDLLTSSRKADECKPLELK